MATQVPPKPTDFYYQIMGQEFGPVTGVQLRDRALDGDINQFTLVRVGDAGEWITASRLRNLFHEDGSAMTHEEVGAITRRPAPAAKPEHESPPPARSQMTFARQPFRALFGDFQFRLFVTPRLLKHIYLLAIVCCLVSIGRAFWQGYSSDATASAGVRLIEGLLSGGITLLFALFALIAIRIALESVIVFFHISEQLERLTEGEEE